MITPEEIREKKIKTVAQGGYDIDEVNELLDDVAESYSSVYEENKELYRKMEILADKIEEYRDEEDSIKSALIIAQKTADKLTSEAKATAETAISQSTASAQKVVVDAKKKAEKLLNEAKQYVESYTKDNTKKANVIIAQAEAKANKAINGAQVVANDIVEEAKNLSSDLVTKAKEDAQFHESLVSKLQSETSSFRENLIALYEAQLENLKDPRILASKVVAEKAQDHENIASKEEEIKSVMEELKNVPTMDKETAEKKQSEIQNKINVALEDNQHEVEAKAAKEEKIEEETAEPTVSREVEPVPPSQEKVASAIKSFTADEITPVAEDKGYVPEISEEAEMVDPNEDDLPFESFLAKKSKEPIPRTKEKISLESPEEDEDEEDTPKFKGFFKKKK